MELAGSGIEGYRGFVVRFKVVGDFLMDFTLVRGDGRIWVLKKRVIEGLSLLVAEFEEDISDLILFKTLLHFPNSFRHF